MTDNARHRPGQSKSKRPTEGRFVLSSLARQQTRMSEDSRKFATAHPTADRLEGRAEIAVRAKKEMQEILDRYKTGISISQVTLQNIQPPEEVQSAFDDAVKAGQDRERLKNEAQAYANNVIPSAQGVAARLTQEAEGYRQAVTANAQGEASRFSQIFTEYSKAPQVTRQRMYLDTMQTVMTNTSKILVDQKGGNSLLYLPLDKLQQIVNPPLTGVPEALAQSTTPSSVQPSIEARSRDAFRSRDREDRP